MSIKIVVNLYLALQKVSLFRKFHAFDTVTEIIIFLVFGLIFFIFYEDKK